MLRGCIDVRGARVHNLKNIDVRIPRDQLVVVTGLSGSGKSSLAFDTVYAEGQRRYVESLSAYARQFLEQVEKPDVDQIDGLSPSISIEQRNIGANPRSTVGTVTEIYDYLRLLFASIGVAHCPSCGREVSSQSVGSMVEGIISQSQKERINILAPIVRGRKGEFRREFEAFRAKGFTKVRVDGETRSFEDDIKLKRHKNHWIDVVVDRVIVKPGIERRLTDAIELALKLAEDVVIVNTGPSLLRGGDRLLSRRFACVECGINIPEMTTRTFSFNSPHGACGDCQGIGLVEDFDPSRIVPDETKSLSGGAIEPWAHGDRRLVRKAIRQLSSYFDIDLDMPFGRLSEKQRDLLLLGPSKAAGSPKLSPIRKGQPKAAGNDPFGGDFEGIIPNLRRRHATGTWAQREALEGFRALGSCVSCDGQRLRAESRSVTVKGFTLNDFVGIPISGSLKALESLVLTDRESLVAESVIREICERLRFLRDVGVGYLSLSRGAATLSGGEAQRIRLATQIGSNLTGVLYVLDEPSIGLHQRDNRLLLATLGRLRDLGNTVVVVEHDEETIRAADYVVDLGSGAGEHGGQVMFQGSPDELLSSDKESLTGMYLRGERVISTPTVRRSSSRGFLTVRSATANNLKSIDVEVPLGVMTVVTGVSGSGKSTLVNNIIYRALARTFYDAGAEPGAHAGIEGIDCLDKVIKIDQSAIGRTPRSNPATYTGVFTFIRELYSLLPESKSRGYRPGRFSFNVKGGRCESCKGAGLVSIEMHFLPDVFVTCEQCNGRRYNRETLEIKYRGVSVSEMLDLTIDQAVPLLENIPSVSVKLRTLQDVGLGYIRLGQSATTLSGGEAQRVKLAKELSRRSTGRTLYILDEPTTGLHFDDTRRLLGVLNKLVDQGNSILVIEHHLDVIKAADHIIDMGPGGGDQGGCVVATGTPEEVSEQPDSETGIFLRRMLTSEDCKSQNN